MAGMGHPVNLIKASKKGDRFIVHGVWENTEHLFGEKCFTQSVMIMKSCLGTPADMQSRMDVVFAPFHNFAQFRPIGNFFKFQMLHRCSCDNHSVKVLVFNIRKGFIEFEKVVLWSILWIMGSGLHQFNIYLQRCIAEHSKKLALCINFLRH